MRPSVVATGPDRSAPKQLLRTDCSSRRRGHASYGDRHCHGYVIVLRGGV